MTTSYFPQVPFYQVDPFTQVYQALYSILEHYEPLDSLVKLGNRIRFDDRDDPSKNKVQYADLPELAIEQPSILCKLFNTSSTSAFTVQYQIMLETASHRLDHLNRVRWEVIRAMAGKADTLDAIEFVKVTRYRTINTSMRESDRGKTGWSEILTFECDLVIQNTDITTEI